MPKLLDHDMERLKQRLLTMGATAERMILDTISMLTDWDESRFVPVEENEIRMDALQREIDEETVRMISVYTPVAADLRILLMVSRINAELERIGDQAINIGFYARDLMREEPLKPLIDLPIMADLAQSMLHDVLDAFTESNSEKALAVIHADDKVDHLNDQVFRELLTYVLSDSKTISRVIGLVLTARSLERIADHAVSIAEDVIYMVQGRDIRHTGLAEGHADQIPPAHARTTEP